MAAGGNWITLDFRGLIFWTYLTLVALQVTLSSIGVLLFPGSGLLRIHLGSMVFLLILFVTGVAVYGKLRRLSTSNEQRALMESRRPLRNVIELKQWWYFPDESDPTEIRVSVVVHQSGRFAGNVIGEQTDSSGSSTTVFESANGPESQRQVRSGETFTYAFPLKILTRGEPITCASPCIYSRLPVVLPPAILQKYLRSRRSGTTTASISTACSRLLPTCQMILLWH